MPDQAATTVDAATRPAAARVLVLLCTYNEAENLPRLFDLLAKHLPQADILVVDDNSPDGTAEVVGQAAGQPGGQRTIQLLLRSGKLGLGTATRDGLQWCLQRDYDFVINMDADLSHDPASAPRLLEVCTAPASTVDVAVGSRYVAGGGFEGLAWHRRLISRALNSYATHTLGLPIRDCSGSFRCYRVSELRKLALDRLTCPGYGFLEEILVGLHRQGAELVEVPIQFQTRVRGTSKLGFSDALGALQVIHRLRQKRHANRTLSQSGSQES